MLRIVAIGACIGLVSYYVEVKRKASAKRASCAVAVRNAVLATVAMLALHYIFGATASQPVTGPVPVSPPVAVPQPTVPPGVEIHSAHLTELDDASPAYVLEDMMAALDRSRRPKPK